MQISTMRRALLPLALLLVALPAISAPAPVYKERPSLETAHRALPKALRDEIELGQSSFPELVERARHSSTLVRTQKEKLICLRAAEKWKEAHYTYPIQHLEYQRNQPPYQSREDQQKIETALKFYRIQYAEAKKKGIFKVPDLKE